MTLHLNKIESDLSTDHRCLEYESYYMTNAVRPSFEQLLSKLASKGLLPSVGSIRIFKIFIELIFKNHIDRTEMTLRQND